MRCNYKGIDKDYGYRVVDICFDEEKEQNILYKTVELMHDRTCYKIDIVSDGYAMCEVDDYEDYKNFMQEWKECKKLARNFN